MKIAGLPNGSRRLSKKRDDHLFVLSSAIRGSRRLASFCLVFNESRFSRAAREHEGDADGRQRAEIAIRFS